MTPEGPSLIERRDKEDFGKQLPRWNWLRGSHLTFLNDLLKRRTPVLDITAKRLQIVIERRALPVCGVVAEVPPQRLHECNEVFASYDLVSQVVDGAAGDAHVHRTMPERQSGCVGQRAYVRRA